MRWSHGSFCQERALQTAEHSEGVWRGEGLIAIVLHSAIAPFQKIAVSLMESSHRSESIHVFALLSRVGNADRCRFFPSSMSSSLTPVKNSVKKGYGPHNQGFSLHLTSLLFISDCWLSLLLINWDDRKSPGFITTEGWRGEVWYQEGPRRIGGASIIEWYQV